jgi:hypothetical protein
MIVPKEHFNCIAALPKPSISEAVSIINKLKNFYQTRYGKKLIFFESGAGSLTDHSGGCIVHAHIHVLTESLAFDKRIREEVKLELSSKQDHSSADKEFGYVWYMNGEGKQYLSNRPLLPSQFLRYLYSSCENISQQWNWRRHPNINGVEEVLVTYADFKAC